MYVLMAVSMTLTLFLNLTHEHIRKREAVAKMESMNKIQDFNFVYTVFLLLLLFYFSAKTIASKIDFMY